MDISPPKTPTDPDFIPDPEELIKSKGRNYKTYPNMSMNAMRYGVSNQGLDYSFHAFFFLVVKNLFLDTVFA